MKNILVSSTKGAQIFIISFFLISIISLFYLKFDLTALGLIVLGYFLYGCLGIVVTFHRLLTHNSYKTNNFIEKAFSLLGCFAVTGSPIAWIAIHINHHLNSDTEKDPHSPRYRGYKIFFLNYEENLDSATKWKMRNIITNQYYRFLHRYYFGIILTWMVLIYSIGGLYALIYFHMIPSLITVIMSNIVNYIGHTTDNIGSSRRYNLSDNSVNNWIWALPSWGESWHNNHHRFPRNFTFSKNWFEIDIAGYIIRLIRTK